MGDEKTEKEIKSDDKKKEEKKEEPPKIGFFQLFRFATGLDYALITVGLLAAMGVGISQPLMFLVFGDMTQSFVDLGKMASCYEGSRSYSPQICELSMSTLTAEQMTQMSVFMDEIMGHTWFFIGLGIGSWLCGQIMGSCMMYAAARQTNQIRIQYFRAILRQDVGYFDTHNAGELNTRLFDDVRKISQGIGDKLGIGLQATCQAIAGVIIGFYYGWKMCLVIMATAPLMAGVGYLFFTATTRFTQAELDAYAKAGDVAEEVLSSIRTVKAFNGQPTESQRYSSNLEDARQVGVKKGTFLGLAMGITYLVLFLVYALAFWYGARLILTDDYTIGDVLISFFGVIFGSFGLSQVGQNMEYYATAQAAAYAIWEILDRTPPIDSSGVGLKPELFKGSVKFVDVKFTYPSRPDQCVLNSISFEAEAEQTVALCGHSGSGKSTCVQLIQRFYDAVDGQVLLDGRDIKEYDLAWLRNQIGVVSQEPVLFDMSIAENLRLGNAAVTDDEMRSALKQANALDFVNRLPEKLNTEVGEGGATLSGGQKQRIAIARALVRNPSILLLDEATSALDTESEKQVQIALEAASKGRTTIVIAHRLSTIKNADKIIGFKEGEIKEEGNHEKLMADENGVYFNLAKLQQTNAAVNETTEKSDTVEVKTIAKVQTTEKQEKKQKELELKQEQAEAEKLGMMKIWALSKKELCINIVGAICALILGGIQPLFAIMFGEILLIFGDYGCAYDKQIAAKISDYENDVSNSTAGLVAEYRTSKFCSESVLMDEVIFWSCMFIVLGGAEMIFHPLAGWIFGMSGENLTKRLRHRSFQQYITMHIGFFDRAENSTGAMTARLASDASKVQGASAMRLKVMCQNIGSLGVAFGIAFAYEWRLTLVCFAFVPFMIGSMAIMMRIFAGEEADKENEALEEAGKCTTQATMNIRTVSSLHIQEVFVKRYERNLAQLFRKVGKKAGLFGFLYGMSLGVIFFMYAGCFYFSGYLIEEGILRPDEFDIIFKVLMALVMGAMTAGEAGAMAPDFGEAKLAANRIITLLNMKSEIPAFVRSDDNDQLVPAGGMTPQACNGEIKFDGVGFVYPTRPDINVLKGLSVTVCRGQTLALVGQSGCGKSTCIQLLERFYNATTGQITVDGVPIDQLSVKWLRSQIGFVQQEPVLFDCSIKDNILYGSEGIHDDSSIRSACEKANALDFITGFQQEFDTMCGKRGNQLSGGQKQRIAIARALIDDPKILLLDEATSALDAESEGLVQKALDNAKQGRTCILIAHRLSTVRDADLIAVIDNGVIVETGTHSELLASEGAYHSLVKNQLS